MTDTTVLYCEILIDLDISNQSTVSVVVVAKLIITDADRCRAIEEELCDRYSTVYCEKQSCS